ncbi:MAG: hypothetical protein PVH92_10735, partial [Anaerolineales bacterium]
EIMADLAERRESRHNITLFNLARLTGQVSELYRNMPGLRISGVSNGRAIHRRMVPQRRMPLRRERIMNHRLQNQRARVLPTSETTEVGKTYGYIDSTDPRYWEAEDVKPFWL